MKLSVFNVGQGDSFLLNTHSGCKHSENPILIDCGPQAAKVSDRVSIINLQVLLTHSHRDHIGGFPKIFKDKSINTLMIPYYLPEILNIAKFLKNKIPNYFGSLNYNKVNKIKDLKLLAEGEKLCNHIDIFNPPTEPSEYFGKYLDIKIDIERALGILREYDIDLPEDKIINYKSPVNSLINLNSPENYQDNARKFVHYFFISLSSRIRGQRTSAANYYCLSHIELTANQASVVLKYKGLNGDWLFTGDADKSVFERLIRSGKDIKSKYLKVPHHGSRENLSQSILDSIKPDIAIISHNNRKFGRSNDPHPHHEIIDLLDINNIKTYYTNDVIKKSKIVKNGTIGIVNNEPINFL